MPPPSFVARGASPSVIRRAVDRRGLAIFAAATAAALLLGATMLFAIWARTRAISLGYELSREGARHQQLLREREVLTLQLAGLKSPARLHRVAERLHMRAAGPDRTVVIVSGRAGRPEPPLVAATR